MDSIVRLTDLRKVYTEFVLRDITWEIPKGFIMGLIGPNGAGKSTTIKLLMSLIRPDGGEVEVFGLTYRDAEIEIKNRVGYVGEEQPFYEHRSVAWTGRFVSQYYDRWDENRFAQLLNSFEISRTKKIRQLSKGMRVKLALAIALSHDPELVILDEPTAGLDPIVRRELLDILRGLTADEKRSVIISSHITDDIARIADYITYMVDGSLVLQGEKDQLLSNWKRIHFREGALQAEVVELLCDVQGHAFGSSGLTRDYASLKPQLARAIAAEDVKVESLGLDDILISFVKGNRPCSV